MAAPIRDGFHAELDELRDISRNSRQYIAQIEARERARTGIASLKVRFNNVFGYYIEISKANLQHAPADYERKQTLVNAERFTTPELKELEAKVLSAEEKILELERQIFAEVRTLRGAACNAHPRDRRRHRGAGRDSRAGAGRGREPLRPAAVLRNRRDARRRRAPSGDREADGEAGEHASSRTTSTWTASASSRSSPARTWAANRRICGRPR